MNRNQQIEYWKKYESFRKPAEQRGYKVFRAMLNRQVKQVIGCLLQNGIRDTIDQLPQLITTHDTLLTMQVFYVSEGLPFAIREFEQLSGQKSHYIHDLKQKGLFSWLFGNRATIQVLPIAFSDYWKKLLVGFVTDNSATKVKGINDTTRKELNKILTDAVDTQQTVAQTATKIRKEFQGMNKWRSANIARTEANSAANYAATIGAESATKLLTNAHLEKFWISTADSRTRDAHLAMLGQASIPMTALFNVGGELMAYPCASGGSARNVCNCRCVVAHRVVRD
jgi:Phage Mu protein F like protein